MDTENLDINYEISPEKLKELNKTYRLVKVSPTQSRDIQSILSNKFPLCLIGGARDSGKSVSLYLVIAYILLGGLGKWKANILLMRNTKESAKKTIFDGVVKSVLEFLQIDYNELKQKSYDRGRITINGHQIRIDSFDVDANNSARLKGYKDITHVFVEEFAEVMRWDMWNQLWQTIPRFFDLTWQETEAYQSTTIDQVTGESYTQTKYRKVTKTQKWRGQVICAFNTPPSNSPILNDFYDLELSEYDGFYHMKPKSGVILEKDYNTGELFPHPDGLKYEDLGWHYSFSTVYDNTVLLKKLKEEGGERAVKLYLYQQHTRYKTTDPYYYLTNTLGLVGTGRSGRVFNNWESISLEEYKKIEATEFYGIDWGFSGEGDPSALTAVKHVPAQKLDELPCIYVNNLLYEKGLSLPDLVKRIMQSVPNYANVDFYIDHMPVAKSELIDKGFSPSYIHLADKGSGSRATSVSYIAGNFKVYFVDNKVLQKEVEKYRWLLDRDGRPTGEPSDGDDHIIDSIKYPVYTKLHPKQNEKSNWWKEYYRLLAQAEA
jgi:hypothetical protein